MYEVVEAPQKTVEKERLMSNESGNQWVDVADELLKDHTVVVHKLSESDFKLDQSYLMS